jgi:hypothetical protein
MTKQMENDMTNIIEITEFDLTVSNNPSELVTAYTTAQPTFTIDLPDDLDGDTLNIWHTTSYTLVEISGQYQNAGPYYCLGNIDPQQILSITIENLSE